MIRPEEIGPLVTVVSSRSFGDATGVFGGNVGLLSACFWPRRRSVDRWGALRSFFRSTPSLWFGAVGGGGLAVLCLTIAFVTYRLPMRVWPLCFVVGAAMGAGLVRRELPRVS